MIKDLEDTIIPNLTISTDKSEVKSTKINKLEESEEEIDSENIIDPVSIALKEFETLNQPIEHALTDQKLIICLKVGCTASIGYENRIL